MSLQVESRYPKITPPTSVPITGMSVDVKPDPANNVNALAQKVAQISSRPKTFSAITLIAITTGVLAYQNIILFFIVGGVVYTAAFLVEKYAESALLGGVGSSAQKAHDFACLYFWAELAMGSTLIGLAVALAFYANAAFAANLLFQGMGGCFIAMGCLAPAAINKLKGGGVIELGSNPSPLVNKLTAFLDKSKDLPDEDLTCFLKIFLSANPTPDKLLKEFEKFYNSGTNIQICFTTLIPLLTSEVIELLAEKYPDELSLEFLSQKLEKNVFSEYLLNRFSKISNTVKKQVTSLEKFKCFLKLGDFIGQLEKLNLLNSLKDKVNDREFQNCTDTLIENIDEAINLTETALNEIEQALNRGSKLSDEQKKKLKNITDGELPNDRNLSQKLNLLLKRMEYLRTKAHKCLLGKDPQEDV